MLPLLFSTLFALGFSIAVLAENYTVTSLAVTPCTFKLQVSPADDFSYIDIIYSTKGATPNNLLSYGSGQSKNQRRCYSSAIISHPNRSARARPLRMELSGTIELDAGLTAKVETGLVWGYAMAMTNFTAATIQGPTNGSSEFFHNATITNRSHPASCEFSKSGERWQFENSLTRYTEPSLVSTFTISGASTGAGTLSEEAELRHRIYVEWLEGCGSYIQWYDCVTYDRFDNPSYIGWDGDNCLNNKTNPGAVDWTKPPPGP